MRKNTTGPTTLTDDRATQRVLLGFALVVGLGLGLGLGGGCSSSNTSIEQSWTAPTLRPSQLQHVVTMFAARDGVLRRTMEDRMAQRLVKIGVRAVPAYQVLTNDDRADRATAIARLRATSYDGVIVMRIIGEPANAPESFDAFLQLGEGELGTITTVVRLEASAYSLQDNQLVWSALIKNVDPSDVGDLINDVTGVVTRELERRAVVDES